MSSALSHLGWKAADVGEVVPQGPEGLLGPGLRSPAPPQPVSLPVAECVEACFIVKNTEDFDRKSGQPEACFKVLSQQPLGEQAFPGPPRDGGAGPLSWDGSALFSLASMGGPSLPGVVTQGRSSECRCCMRRWLWAGGFQPCRLALRPRGAEPPLYPCMTPRGVLGAPPSPYCGAPAPRCRLPRIRPLVSLGRAASR